MSACFALIPAAGSGSRLGGPHPKQYQEIAGRPMLWHAASALARHPRILRVYVVLAPTDAYFERHDWSAYAGRLAPLRVGGSTRAESVLNGLLAMGASADDWVLVHDAARPCLSPSRLDALFAAVENDAVGGLLAMPMSDTVKQGDEGGRVAVTLPRQSLWAAQTPQMFRHGLLTRALLQVGTDGPTDEASAVEALGLKPRLVVSDSSNLKVTYAPDLELAACLLRARGEPA